MYDWLCESLLKSGTIVTANRRLARHLKNEYSIQQHSAGASAWESPKISVWQDWLISTNNDSLLQASMPTRLNAHQSQWLWEQCWQKDIGEDTRITSLVRLSREAWQRLADWQVPITEIARAAQNSEQQAFARVAGRYLAMLQRDNMVDDAGLGAQVLESIDSGKISLTGTHTFAGFDRRRPIAIAIENAMRAAGIEVRTAPDSGNDSNPSLQAFADNTSEQRAAGAWARAHIEANPGVQVAIIANNLESDADGVSRRVREGATPGWQYGHRSLYDAVNVPAGQRLADYPAIAIALTSLRWLLKDIKSSDVSLLFRSPLLGSLNTSARHQLELRLRALPDRAWSPSMITSEFRGRDDIEANDDWMARLSAFSKRRHEIPNTARPAEWVVFVDETLKLLGWPGDAPLDSAEFQLVNRWRELLNEFARLSLVSPTMTPKLAIARLELLAADTFYQPESASASIQLIGPMDASGSEFDALWISGLTSNNWPPQGSPSMLISRRLQEKYGMPDSTPGDTCEHAEQILLRLMTSAETVICSYALDEDDTEQSASSFLSTIIESETTEHTDPGWLATSLSGAAVTRMVADSIPPVRGGEKISGGAAAIQRQIDDPVSAFVQSRLGARIIYPQAVGIPALMRGNLIHDALHHLYIELPSSETIRSWQESDLSDRIAAALDDAFVRHSKNTDATLKQLLTLERRRLSQLLEQFVVADSSRGEFKIASVEGEFEFISGHIRLPLRFDRCDSFDDGGIAILDYKTGAKKLLLNRRQEAQQIQLFVYASATTAPVSALALINIDSREISFDGAGAGYTDVDQWPELLQGIKAQISAACADLQSGDVRINIEQGVEAARSLNVLTRYTELLRDNG